MALTITEALAQEWMGLTAEERQQGFFEYLSATLCVWGIKTDDGWIMMDQKEKEYLPLWSHEILASMWAQQHHPEAKPCAISLNTFKTEWLPGLITNEIGIVVSPSSKLDESVNMSAQETLDALS